MLVLALDTSSVATTVAVAEAPSEHEVRVLADECEVAPNRHAEVLAPMIVRTLRAAGASRADIGRVCVGVGPGPFTGLRVGLVTALAFGDALGVPVRGVCSLDAIAHFDERPWPDGFAVVTDARRKEVYWATYRDGRRVSDPAVDHPDAVAARLEAGTTVVGAGALLYRAAFADFPADDRSPYPAAGDLAELGWQQSWQLPVEPLYLRRPDARPPGPPKRVTPA